MRKPHRPASALSVLSSAGPVTFPITPARSHPFSRVFRSLMRPLVDRWRHERTLRSERLFSNAMIESMPGIVYFYDMAGRFLRWNTNFETVSGYSSAEIARMHPLDFFAEEHKALLEERIAAVFENGESSVEAPFVSKDGTATPYFFTGRRVLFEGRPCLVGAGIDIADRKQAENRTAESERKYRELVEHANSIILRWSSDGRVTFLNEFGQRFFGYSAEEILGRHVMETIVPPLESGGRDLARLMEEICSAPETYEENINENMRRNGERVWISWTNRIVRDADGKAIELLSVGTDVTARKQTEEKLRALEEQVRQAQKMEAIGQLAGGVAHDFNNILAAIMGNIQLALADTASEHPARESLEEIKKAGERAKSIVQQILAFARHQPLARTVIHLGPTLQEALGFMRATLPSGVHLTSTIDADTPPVLADATQVHQVIVNLCTNSWHALEDRPGHIEVRLQPVTLDQDAANRIQGLKPGRFSRISVTDTGKGMDEATLARIFEPFFTTKPPGKGSGLGLSVVHGIMQSHDGAIAVNSTPGRGTTFEIYFPAAIGAASTLAPTARDGAQHLGNGEHILYIDDEEPLVFLATRMLKRMGYRISGYHRSEDAIRAFREDPTRFDLIITDHNMPETSGLQVASELLAVRADVPIVLCSGHVTDELRELAHYAGIREVLYKPSSMEDFGQAIHRLIAKA